METETSSPEWMQPITQKLRKAITPKLRKLSQSWASDLSIFRVPNKLRRVNEEAYSPRVVSIGPFHSSAITSPLLKQISANKVDHVLAEKDDHLQAMEDHKCRYTVSLICRTRNPGKIYYECGAAILGLDTEVRGSYTGNIKLQPHELAEIMLIDGCFILELFIRSWPSTEREYDDPISHKAWMVSLRRDLTLLENQIPFFILQTLYDIVVPQFDSEEHLGSLPFNNINELALCFFHPDLKHKRAIFRDKHSKVGMDSEHLLDLLHKFYLPTYPEAETEGKEDLNRRLKYSTFLDTDLEDQLPWGFKATLREKCNTSLVIDPEDQKNGGFRECVTQLLASGIEFEKGSEEHFFDRVSVNMEFNLDRGVIKMPKLRIDETTESLLRNLIALEQCKPGSRDLVFSSYAILMTSLVRSPLDITLLEKRGIIAYDLGGIRNVWNFFKNMSMGVVLEDSYFGKLCEAVNEYQKSGWNLNEILGISKLQFLRYLETLKYDYSTPLNLVSFIISFVILNFLTILQTCYTISSYYAGADPH